MYANKHLFNIELVITNIPSLMLLQCDACLYTRQELKDRETSTDWISEIK